MGLWLREDLSNAEHGARAAHKSCRLIERDLHGANPREHLAAKKSGLIFAIETP